MAFLAGKMDAINVITITVRDVHRKSPTSILIG
jgi:hypothetical protein